MPWNYKKSWIVSLIKRAKVICSDDNFKTQLKTIKKFSSWNGFPKFLVNKIVKRALTTPNRPTENNNDNNDVITLWVRIPYLGDSNTILVKSLINKLRRYFQTNKTIEFKIIYTTTKLSYYTNLKDHTNYLNRSHVVYKFNCPGCSASYIGKTTRNLIERCEEHALDEASTIRKHLLSCENVSFMCHLLNIGTNRKLNKRECFKNAVFNNVEIIDQSPNWNVLLFKEAIHIKNNNVTLNKGVKASKELRLFN